MSRLIFIAHGPTQAQLEGRFPVDEPLVDGARAPAMGRDFRAGTPATCSPERRCVETARLLGFEPATHLAPVDCDYGEWTGKLLVEVGASAPPLLARWLESAKAAPPAGESFADVCGRVARWFDALDSSPTTTVVVTHPVIIRAALCHVLRLERLEAAYGFDIEPFGRITLTSDGGGRWKVRIGA